ncbi:MAG: HD domain-containing protein [Anaerolineales bacterium]
MHPLLSPYTASIERCGDVARDVPLFLRYHGYPHVVEHSRRVALTAAELAARLGVPTEPCVRASWLHDVGVVVPEGERETLLGALGIEILPEERAFPLILHQKVSALLAHSFFEIEDEAVLGAVGCHTTLRAGATPVDKVLFLADKLAWDRPGSPPYAAEIRAHLERSLDAAVCAFLAYLWERRATLGTVHPWFVAAYGECHG